MNPGTVLFIVLGFIGLLIYISKALKPSSLENFAVIDESSISNRGKEGLSRLQDGTLNLESLIGAISTPAISMSNSTSFGGGSGPSVSDFAKINRPVEPPAPVFSNVQFDKANMGSANLPPKQELISGQQPVMNKAPALPALTPASFINMQETQGQQTQPVIQEQIQEPMTVSDTQGTLLTKSPLPFEAQKSKQIEKHNKRKKQKTKVVYMKNECPKLPDMSLYIRKDSIPCWGCNLK